MQPGEIIGTVTGVLAFLASVGFWVADRRRTQKREREERVEARDEERRAAVEGVKEDLEQLEKRLIRVEAQVAQAEPLWRDIRFAAVHAATSLLHSPDDELGLDALIDKFRKGTLDAQETQEFKKRLRAVHESDPTPRLRQAADILLREMERHG